MKPTATRRKARRMVNQLADTRERQDREDPADQPGDRPQHALLPVDRRRTGTLAWAKRRAHHGLGMADLAAKPLGHGPVPNELDPHRE